MSLAEQVSRVALPTGRLQTPDRSLSRPLLYGGPLVLVVALVLYVAEFAHWHGYLTQIDMMVYRYGGQRALHGLDLYSTGIFGSHRILLFTYTPFAALSFTPLTLVSMPWLRGLALVGAVVLMAYSVQRMVTALELPCRRGWWAMTALLAGLCLWSEPVRYSVELGQINLVILAVVVADLLGLPTRKCAGIGIGLVAGIKLTPAIFVVYLLLIGRRRAALVAAVAFVATVMLGFAILPRDSASYWFASKFDDPQRISPDPTASSSVGGLFLRLHYPAELATAVSVALAVICLAVAVAAWRRSHPVLGMSLVGLAGAAASPFSWSHHWIWLVPLIVHLLVRGYAMASKRALWAGWLLWALTAGWLISLQGTTPASGIVAWRPGGLWNALLPSGYVFVLLVTVSVSAIWLWRATPRVVRGTPQASPIGNARPACAS